MAGANRGRRGGICGGICPREPIGARAGGRQGEGGAARGERGGGAQRKTGDAARAQGAPVGPRERKAPARGGSWRSSGPMSPYHAAAPLENSILPAIITAIFPAIIRGRFRRD
eukprot:6576633-Pyramimonas_sp.AAC.1